MMQLPGFSSPGPLSSSLSTLLPGDMKSRGRSHPRDGCLVLWAGTEQATALLWETSLRQALGDSPG